MARSKKVDVVESKAPVRKAVLSSMNVLSKLESEVSLKPTLKKSEANKEKWELSLDPLAEKTAVQWVSAKTIWDIVNARMNNTKEQFCSYALEKMAEKMFQVQCHPGNPNVVIESKDGQADHKFILVMQDNFKVEVPKNYPEGVNQLDWLKDHYKSLLESVGLSEENAKDLVDSEMEIFPVTGIRSLTELLDGHYGEKRVWVDSSEDEKIAGTKLAALLMWDGKTSPPEPLSPSDKSIIVRRDTTVTIKSEFYSRITMYCDNVEQLKGILSIIKPIMFPSDSKFAVNDSEPVKLQRKIEAAAEILGS